jgi:hypothetical protein
MTTRYYSSIAQDTTISTPILAGTTTVSIASTIGWPLTYPFSLALDYGTALEEIVDVTSVSGLTATITRGVDSTVAVAHGVGAVVRHVIIARDIRDSNTHINTTSGAGAHGILDVSGYTTTVTAAGTTTLTSASTALQFFTGTTTQTVVLPVTSTLALGQKFRVVNNSTGSITVQSSGLNTITTVTAGVTMDFYCVLITGTTAASWNNNVGGVGTVTGTGALVLATSPTLATPALGVATATSINGATIPSVADTLVGRATTDTLTNKDLTDSTNKFNWPSVAGKNAVIDGGMDIWQRGTSIALAASTGTTYTADRWCTQTGANQAITISRQVTGDTTNLPNIQYALRYQRNSGQTGTGTLSFIQNIETINTIPFVGKQVTVSFYARAGANFSSPSNLLSFTLITGTGTDQNAFSTFTNQANAIGVGDSLTTTWQRFSHTATLGTSITQLALDFAYAPTGAAGANDYFDITGVQLELGSTATTFSRAGGSIGGELALCQRYYRRYAGNAGSQNPLCSAFAISTVSADGTLPFSVPMRVAPTSNQSAVADLTFTWSAGTSTTSAISIDLVSADAIFIRLTTTGLTAGQGGYMRVETGTNKYFELSAEL